MRGPGTAETARDRDPLLPSFAAIAAALPLASASTLTSASPHHGIPVDGDLVWGTEP
ncbi:hypothetical protein WDA79_07975 [Streptomyces sp. A475]|uniref:hypothetical protein n=1 Tax=Streptomyces sp. A475 TaxID=3131976 RepID=UPI0030C94DC8